ncbi:hypothetical protein Csa_009083 [Cucumis sativus]|uniref:Uncharacterized protein n=1 Tax=Cucumis sativus TaxID=3659 RepID=A0A0A0KN35_CUCSA|nr:hypothetical protein Csa_009083 [Cucumis sativus]
MKGERLKATSTKRKRVRWNLRGGRIIDWWQHQEKVLATSDLGVGGAKESVGQLKCGRQG